MFANVHSRQVKMQNTNKRIKNETKTSMSEVTVNNELKLGICFKKAAQ
jgi:hypothetical protein